MTITANKAKEMTLATINKKKEYCVAQAEKCIEERIEKCIVSAAESGERHIVIHEHLFDSYDENIAHIVLNILKNSGYNVAKSNVQGNFVISW